MDIEISIKSPVSQSDLFELRNLLMDEIDGLGLAVKEQVPQEGEMVIGIIQPILIGAISVVVNSSVQEFYGNVIKPKLSAWLKRKEDKDGKQPEVLSTLSSNTETFNFLESREGETTSLTDFKYSIDKDKTQVILIGNAEYDDNFPPIPPVKGNLEDLFNIITDISHIGVPKENVTTLYNKNSGEIEEVLLRKSRLENLETLIIYFAGHGYRTDVKKLYLITKNSKRVDEIILGAIDYDFISNNILKRSKASQKILIVDACHGGIAAQGQEDLAENLEVKGTYIIASSSGDEVSYFNKNNRNTYFSEAIVGLLRNGKDDSQEMIALEDLYESAKQNQTDKNLSLPVFKNGLNIPASKFFLARNPKFSQQKQKQRPFELYEKGLFEDALVAYRVLLDKYPDDEGLRKEAIMCENEILFQEISYEADELFNQKKYKQALEKYQRILRIKSDPGVSYKMNKCMQQIQKENVSNTTIPGYTKETISGVSPLPGANDHSSAEKLKAESIHKESIKDKTTKPESPVTKKNLSNSTANRKIRRNVFKMLTLIAASALIVSFFFPWVNEFGEYSKSGWKAIFNDVYPLEYEKSHYAVLLAPICAFLSICLTILNYNKFPAVRIFLFCLPVIAVWAIPISIYQYHHAVFKFGEMLSYNIKSGFYIGLFFSACLALLAFTVKKQKNNISS